MTEDGKPYAPIRYKQIMQECYLIAKQTNTSIIDIRDKMTPNERRLILKFIYDEYKQSQELMKKAKNK